MSKHFNSQIISKESSHVSECLVVCMCISCARIYVECMVSERSAVFQTTSVDGDEVSKHCDPCDADLPVRLGMPKSRKSLPCQYVCSMRSGCVLS